MPYTPPTRVVPLTTESLRILGELTGLLSLLTLTSPTSTLLMSSASLLDLPLVHSPSGSNQITVADLPKLLFAKNRAAAPSADNSSSSLLLATIVPGATPRTSADDAPRRPLFLRKKSGEVVKLLLKLPLLARTQSEPLHKKVLFAAQLENVKTFDEFELPLTVLLQNSPVGTPTDTPALGLRRANFYYTSSDDEDDYNSSDDLDDTLSHAADYDYRWKVVATNTTSVTHSKTFAFAPVTLDTARLLPTGETFQGVVCVQNLAFEKHVSVKLTVDKWHTLLLIKAFYSGPHPLHQGYDLFKFDIRLSNLNLSFLERHINVEFCLRYDVNGESLWDNNNGNNYRVLLKKFAQPKPVELYFDIPLRKELPKPAYPTKSAGRSKNLSPFSNRYNLDDSSLAYLYNAAFFLPPPRDPGRTNLFPSASTTALSTTAKKLVPGLGRADELPVLRTLVASQEAPAAIMLQPLSLKATGPRPKYSRAYRQRLNQSNSATPLESVLELLSAAFAPSATSGLPPLSAVSSTSPPLSAGSHSPFVDPVAGPRMPQAYHDLIKSYCFYRDDLATPTPIV